MKWGGVDWPAKGRTPKLLTKPAVVTKLLVFLGIRQKSRIYKHLPAVSSTQGGATKKAVNL